MRTWLLALAVVGLIAATVQAGKIRVPKRYPNIQAGIDAAEDGDVVIVSDGVWTGPGNKNLDFLGLGITVRSKHGPDNCIIDCEGDGRGFRFHSGENRDSTVRGFTIRNGKATQGAGIVCENRSDPTIINCLIVNNAADADGGGVYCADSGPAIINCLIEGNTASGGGGGISSDYSGDPVIRNCSIVWNVSADGGGVRAISNNAVVKNCILWGNKPNQIALYPTVFVCDVEGGWPGRGNIDKKPRFVTGPLGDFYLSHKKAGQEKNSPCRNGGEGTAKELGLKKTTTRTDGKKDKKAVDMGYHYPR